MYERFEIDRVDEPELYPGTLGGFANEDLRLTAKVETDTFSSTSDSLSKESQFLPVEHHVGRSWPAVLPPRHASRKEAHVAKHEP